MRCFLEIYVEAGLHVCQASQEAIRCRADEALEGEKAVKGVAMLKGDLTRKTAALKAALADLEKVSEA